MWQTRTGDARLYMERLQPGQPCGSSMALEPDALANIN
jgi:hypothetical protein